MRGADLTRAGEMFGERIKELVGGALARFVIVEGVEGDSALVSVYDDGTPLPVPLSLLNIEGAAIKVTPAVGSAAVIGFLNGDGNRPYFLSFSSVDRIEFSQSRTRISFTSDPEDPERDEVTVEVGGSQVRITKDTIESNGGGNGGTVLVGELTAALNNFVTAFNAHTHTNGNGGAPTGVPMRTAGRFNRGDYENEKMTQ